MNPRLITTQFVLTKPGHMGEFQNFYAWEYITGSLSFFKKLEYVHELQNLFNIIKNQELVFSPNLSLSFRSNPL